MQQMKSLLLAIKFVAICLNYQNKKRISIERIDTHSAVEELTGYDDTEYIRFGGSMVQYISNTSETALLFQLNCSFQALTV